MIDIFFLGKNLWYNFLVRLFVMIIHVYVYIKKIIVNNC